MSASTHTIGIRCRECQKIWKLNIEITGNSVETFASLCECGAIIVGNYNRKLDLKSKGKLGVVTRDVSRDEKYLSNGHFDILELDEQELEHLPELQLE